MDRKIYRNISFTFPEIAHSSFLEVEMSVYRSFPSVLSVPRVRAL